jgi:acetyl esterase/lipase
MSNRMMKVSALTALLCTLVGSSVLHGQRALKVWPDRPPGDSVNLPPESDVTQPTDGLVAGRGVIRLGNVSTPTLTVFSPSTGATGTAVIVCPGGGFRLLAMDLEGTEVANWLNRIGVTALVLKYRVPARPGLPAWRAAVQDAQRAVSLARSHAAQWSLNPKKIGICGFSAGGQTAGMLAILGDDRQYPPVDEVDRSSCRPNFGILVYPSDFVDRRSGKLMEPIRVAAGAPPVFLVQTYDDPVSPLNVLELAAAWARSKVPVETHLFARGGHGYGVRQIPNEPCTFWTEACERWLRASHWLER